MIPKIIHYCWFGNHPKSELIEKCITSWKTYLPDSQIIEWNEQNSILDTPFVQDAYAAHQWAFVSDYVRFKALADLGGIYLDSDVLVLKSFDELLIHPCFFSCETTSKVNSAAIGAIANHPFIISCLDDYKNQIFDPVNSFVITTYLTQKMNTLGFRKINHITPFKEIYLYPPVYFCAYPFPPIGHYSDYITSSSFGVHLWNGSWLSEWQYLRMGLLKEAFQAIQQSETSKNASYFFKLFLYLLASPYWIFRYQIWARIKVHFLP